MKKIFGLILSSVFCLTAYTQDEAPAKDAPARKTRKEEKRARLSAIAKQEEEGVIKYSRHIAIGGNLMTDGYGGFIEVARAQSIRRSLLFQLQITERKHQKEIKQSNVYDVYGITNPLIYGKVNFFYPVKLGVQQQYLLGNKGNKNGVSVSVNGGGGLIAGLLRPYLVEVQKTQGAPSEFIGFDPNDTAFYFLTGPYIGGPGFNNGWNKMKITPGAYAKLGVRFDFGKYNEILTAAEVGLMGEYYLKKIPQMAFVGEKDFFFSAYVAVVFGRRK